MSLIHEAQAAVILDEQRLRVKAQIALAVAQGELWKLRWALLWHPERRQWTIDECDATMLELDLPKGHAP